MLRRAEQAVLPDQPRNEHEAIAAGLEQAQSALWEARARRDAIKLPAPAAEVEKADRDIRVTHEAFAQLARRYFDGGLEGHRATLAVDRSGAEGDLAALLKRREEAMGAYAPDETVDAIDIEIVRARRRIERLTVQAAECAKVFGTERAVRKEAAWLEFWPRYLTLQSEFRAAMREALKCQRTLRAMLADAELKFGLYVSRFARFPADYVLDPHPFECFEREVEEAKAAESRRGAGE